MGRPGARADPAVAPVRRRADAAVVGAAEPLLFGAVATQSATTAVVRRLRAAIALGLLADGDRLPREAELVRRLGVTAFATREALGILREEGLVVTRAGNHGGSFVTLGTDRALLTSGELRRMSATELRDLGDWRQMLASVTASLAAQRASESSVSRLRHYAAALASAQTELQARRAHGRFHLELAAAAQSTRMTHAELAMYEEFDWLLGAALADPQRRQDSATELETIAEAVARRRPERARVAAQVHSASTLDTLIKLRLVAIAEGAVEGSSRTHAAGDVSDEVTRMLSIVEAALLPVAAKASELLRGVADAAELRTALARAAMSALVGDELGLDGVGFMAQPSVLPGADHWMAWWQLNEQGVVADEHHVMDARRDDFYDYTAQEYFTVPQETGRLAAQGPYVDFGGTNDYSITFSIPVLVDEQFVGVAAADLSAAMIERRLAPWLAASDAASVLINGDHRVIVTNVAGHTVGDVLAPVLTMGMRPVGSVGWAVLQPLVP